MIGVIIIFLIFAMLLVITLCSEGIMEWSEFITAACTVISTLLGVWGIISYAFRRRDKEIKQLLLSEQEFKDHKETVSNCLLSFSKRLDKNEEEISRKLDNISTTVNSHSITLAKLEERTKETSK